MRAIADSDGAAIDAPVDVNDGQLATLVLMAGCRGSTQR